MLRGEGTILGHVSFSVLEYGDSKFVPVMGVADPRRPRSPLIVDTSLRDSGRRIRCRSHSSACARETPEVYFRIVIVCACLEVVQYLILGSRGKKSPWVFENV